MVVSPFDTIRLFTQEHRNLLNGGYSIVLNSTADTAVMSRNMKCTICGGQEFVDCVISTKGGLGDEVDTTVSNASTSACRQCGHIEWFLSEKTMKDLVLREKQTIEYQKQLKEYEQKKAILQEKIERFNKIIADEDQTVRTIKEAKEKIILLENELKSLRKPDGPNGPRATMW